MAPRILIFGSTGQLARELARAEWRSQTNLMFLDRSTADLRHPEILPDIINSRRPDAIVIAAAYTAVDKAEAEPSLAATVNAQAPGVISRAAADLSIPILFVSTDYVFDGEKPTWYRETDAPNPLCAYGRSKLAGELAVSGGNSRHVILRTSWLYSPFGTNFVRTMARLADEREEVRVVADQQGCPTAAGDLASAIGNIVPIMLDTAAPTGVFHLAGASEATWHAFAEAVFVHLGARGRKRPRNLPIATSSYPTAARRPANSRLSSKLASDTFGVTLPRWEDSLPKVMHELLA